MNKKVSIAVVLSTDGLDYDDRVRKEILSIKKLFPNIIFKIFAVVPKNISEEGITEYGIPYELIRLESRNQYKSGTHLLSKAWDFWKSIKPKIIKFDYIWCADIQTFLIVLFCKKPVLWDLHELPLAFMSNAFMKLAFKIITLKPKLILHANEYRISYLKKEGMCVNYKKHDFIRNFPSFSEILPEPDDLYLDFLKWVDKDKCIYLQGLDDDRRAAYECISAVMKVDNLKAVVIGKFNSEILKVLKEKYKDKLDERIYFTGMIKQQLTPLYIRHSVCTLVFYKNISPNNWLCEANRFYQNIVNGNPVIVGSNPSMATFVKEYDLGIVTTTDGGNIEEISEAIKLLLKNYSHYRNKVLKNRKYFNWDSQEDKIRSIVNRLIN